MSSRNWGVVFGIVTFVLAQVIFYQYQTIQSLNYEIKITEKTKRIEEDQSRELMYLLTTTKIENESTGVKQFVAGVAAAIKSQSGNPSNLEAVWHDGYNKGAAVKSYEEELKTTYTNNKGE